MATQDGRHSDGPAADGNGHQPGEKVGDIAPDGSTAPVDATRPVARNLPAEDATTPVVRTAGRGDATTPEPSPHGPPAQPRPGAGSETRREDPHRTVPERPGAAGALPAGRANPVYPYEAGDEILPGYRLIHPLGRGGFGEVWKARGPGGTEVAVKVLAHLDSSTGVKEYRSLQRIKLIRHPHIVPLHGVWLKDRQGRVLSEAETGEFEKALTSAPTVSLATARGSLELVTVMGLGDETLDGRLRAVGGAGLPREDVFVWMAEVARGLDFLNDTGKRPAVGSQAIQHCDIKPQNVLLVAGVAQICDLGLARFQDSHTQEIFASLPWAAPELLDGNAAATTDQYSLAVMAMQLVSGRLPYPHGPDGQPLRSEIRKIKTTGELDFSGWNPAAVKVLRMATAIDPAKRYRSCEEFVKALRLTERVTEKLATARLSGTERTTPEGARAPAKASAARGPGRWLAAAGAGAAALALVAAVVASRRGGQSAAPPAGPPAVAPVGVDQAAALAKEVEALRAELANLTGKLGLPASAKIETVLDGVVNGELTLQEKLTGYRSLERYFALHPEETLTATPDGGEEQKIGRWDVIVGLSYYLGGKPDATTGDLATAEGLARESLSRSKDDIERAGSLDSLGVVLARKGDWKGAVEALREAVKLETDPDRKKTYEDRLGRFQQAKTWGWNDSGF